MTNYKRLSKFISLVLRHRPEDFGVVLDDEGFADVRELFDAVKQHYEGHFTREDLIYVLTEPDRDGKQRFELDEDRVRALYGHNRRAHTVNYEPAVPPEKLYHGTVKKALRDIRKQGLRPQERQYVHLSTTPERAMSVGARRGKPVLLTIHALEAFQEGIVFYHPEDEHYLARVIPVDYITIED